MSTSYIWEHEYSSFTHLSIQINILLPTEEAGDVIYVASLEDSEIETYCNKITKMIDDGTQYIAEIQEKLKESPTYVRAIIQTTGSQEALYMLGKVFANPGEYVITEAPTYVGTISALKASGIKIVGVEMDHYGMRMDVLREKLKKYPNPKFIYVIPNFQNPSGITLSFERRKELLEIANERGLTVIEDDPYGALRFAARATLRESRPSVAPY